MNRQRSDHPFERHPQRLKVSKTTGEKRGHTSGNALRYTRFAYFLQMAADPVLTAKAKAVYEKEGLAAAVEQTGIKKGTIGSWVSREKWQTSATKTMQEANEVNCTSIEARKQHIAGLMMDELERTILDMNRPIMVSTMVGKVELPKPEPKDRKNLQTGTDAHVDRACPVRWTCAIVLRRTRLPNDGHSISLSNWKAVQACTAPVGGSDTGRATSRFGSGRQAFATPRADVANLSRKQICKDVYGRFVRTKTWKLHNLRNRPRAEFSHMINGTRESSIGRNEEIAVEQV